MSRLKGAIGSHKTNFHSDVMHVQHLLNQRFGANLKEDGKFGPKTRAAVFKFQISNFIKPDGIIHREGATLHRLTKDVRATPQHQANQFSEMEYLAKTIYGEARGQTYQEKLAVGWVIRNRVENTHGKGTYGSVVTAPKQFTCWSITNDPRNYAAIMKPEGQAWAEAQKAAEEIISAPKNANMLPGVVSYYSPASQKYLHKMQPTQYISDVPAWTKSMIKVVNPVGIPDENFAFFKPQSHHSHLAHMHKSTR